MSDVLFVSMGREVTEDGITSYESVTRDAFVVYITNCSMPRTNGFGSAVCSPFDC